MSNPLTETNPLAIEELLSRDPLCLTPEDVEENTKLLVLQLRAERVAWAEAKNKTKLTGKRMSGQTTKKAQRLAAIEAIKTNTAKISMSDILGGGK